jgi:sec-independent protein translocase protein TatB
MFDIGFWELAIIGVVALLVVGPERLPGLARTAGMWVGRARRFVSGVKADIDREIAADELKKALAKQANSESLYDIIEETKQTILEAKGEDKAASESESRAAVTHKSNDASG